VPTCSPPLDGVSRTYTCEIVFPITGGFGVAEGAGDAVAEAWGVFVTGKVAVTKATDVDVGIVVAVAASVTSAWQAVFRKISAKSRESPIVLFMRLLYLKFRLQTLDLRL